MKKTNRKIRWIACLLCALTLLSAVPLFPLDVAAATEYQWGYTGTDLVDAELYPGTIADAGTLDVAWIRGGYYQADAGVKDLKASKNHSYTEGIIVYPGMKLWWTDPSDPAGHGEVAAVKFWTDATFTTLISGGNDYMGSRKDCVIPEDENSRDWIFGTGGTTANNGSKYNGMLMQNQTGANGICYTYWNFTNTPKYVTLSYKGIDAVPIFYSAGEPQLIGEDNVPLPRQKLDVTWTEDNRYTVNKTSGAISLETYPVDGSGNKTGATGYLLSSAITLKPGQTVALFGDRALNGQTGEDSQVVHDTDPTCVFAAFSSNTTMNQSTLVATVDIGSAKINAGPITNTGVVVYQYTNSTNSVQYVRVSYCCTNQRGWEDATNKIVDYDYSNVYLYEDFDSYKAIRTNTQAVAGYFSNEGATTVNTTVKTPSAPAKTQDGVFFGWQVEYTRNSAAVKEFYPPETELKITTETSSKKKTEDIESEIKMTPVYLDALPFTYGGASIRTLMPTGLQFKLYFRKSDFDKMVDEANATKGSLSIGAFAVPDSHFRYYLLQNGMINEGVTLEDAGIKDSTDEDLIANISESFTKEWFDENETALRNYASSKLNGAAYTAPMYLDGRTEGSYVTIENIDDVDYCVAYYTLAESHIYFDMNWAARAYLTIQYESYDAQGNMTYKYSDPLYGEFKTTNIRNTEEVMIATLRDRGTDYAGIQYFTESESEMQADVEAGGVIFGTWKFSKDGKVYESFTYYDPDLSKEVTVYTRRFSGATLAAFAGIIAGTKYDPAKYKS